MALNITGNITLNNGMELTSLYVRTEAQLTLAGNRVGAFPQFFISEQSYLNGNMDVNPDIELVGFAFDYDRTTDGVDILDFANQQAKLKFEELGYTAEIIDL